MGLCQVSIQPGLGITTATWKTAVSVLYESGIDLIGGSF
jgi:hypothetical protein